MNNDIAISINNLTKVYPNTQGGDGNGLTTLNNVSLDIRRGEAIGIVGRNGAGKSTLLKILSGITKPTAGNVKIRGEVSSLLSIGAGLHPDLTGRENLKIIGSLSNISGNALMDATEKIAAFSELGSFIDSPVKTYSDGMYVRLMLSSFFIFPCDILLIDEVIAAGDAGFRAKCYRQFEKMIAAGKTIVFVTHNMQDVLTLCTRAIYLDKEIKLESNDRNEVVNAYLKDVTSGMKNFEDEWVQNEDMDVKQHITHANSAFINQIQNRDFKLISASVNGLGKSPDDAILVDDAVSFEFTYEKVSSVGNIELAVAIFNLVDAKLLSDSHTYRQHYNVTDEPAGIYTINGNLPAGFLNAGRYYISLIVSQNKQRGATWQNVLRFDVVQSEWRKKEPWSNNAGLVMPLLSWQVSVKQS